VGSVSSLKSIALGYSSGAGSHVAGCSLASRRVLGCPTDKTQPAQMMLMVLMAEVVGAIEAIVIGIEMIETTFSAGGGLLP
jgi:cobalamin biosynthesis Mg chelatase CobN